MGRLLSEKTLLAAILVIALVVGLYARFHGFGERVLATDEYLQCQ
jgi:hypothetical protein